jgi:arginyl-tRNA synthetase
VIPGDIGRALGLRACGTWRPPPPSARPGTYASSLPFQLARAAGQDPAEVAAGLAARLRSADWIDTASVTGGGYLTVTVTPAALAELAVRVPAAGGACAASDTLRGTRLAVPGAAADLASARTWAEARELATAPMIARLSTAAGATLEIHTNANTERAPAPDAPAAAALTPGAAVAVAGAEAVRYALARNQARAAGPVNPEACVRNTLDNPYFKVRYAHVRAASVLRWATGLGVGRGRPEEFRPGLLAHRSERELLDAISWLPERVASAARRRRPGAFLRYLESLADAWLGCNENCPALPFGGRSAPPDEATANARLWLAAAAGTALQAGLRITDMVQPVRL